MGEGRGSAGWGVVEGGFGSPRLATCPGPIDQTAELARAGGGGRKGGGREAQEMDRLLRYMKNNNLHLQTRLQRLSEIPEKESRVLMLACLLVPLLVRLLVDMSQWWSVVMLVWCHMTWQRCGAGYEQCVAISLIFLEDVDQSSFSLLAQRIVENRLRTHTPCRRCRRNCCRVRMFPPLLGSWQAA